MATLDSRAQMERDQEIASQGVIDGEEFEEARRDPKVQERLAAARAYRAKLEFEGRNR